MARATDILVVGGGVIGCAIAYELAKAGRIPKKLYATASSPIEGLPEWTS